MHWRPAVPIQSTLPPMKRSAMPRHLFIVSRQFPDLYGFLTERFSDDDKAAVILDRRVGERRLMPAVQGAQNGRRGHVDRRRRGHLDEDLRTQAHVVVTLP